MSHLLIIKLKIDSKKQYPEAHIIRFDFDTTRNKNTHLKLLKDFEEHKADIMLGTQMIAKGLDFSNVTFVGVLMADLSLMVPDFRASERTFQLLCQGIFEAMREHSHCSLRWQEEAVEEKNKVQL